MAEHVQIRALEHVRGDEEKPKFVVALETRDRPGPAFKAGVYSDDDVWFQLRGGLMIARGKVVQSWRGEFSRLDEIRARCEDAHLPESFWQGRPRAGYAIVARVNARWIEPYWAGPRTYGYEWIVLEGDSKRKTWLEDKPPPRGGESLREEFLGARARSFAE